jgi:hypothetical protein
MVKKAGQNAQGDGLFARPVVLRLKQLFVGPLAGGNASRHPGATSAGRH